MAEKRLITAALPFVNNVPHLGNIVGSHLPADIFARYCRLRKYDIVFIGGTDEHGTATEIAAYAYKITPKELCDHFYRVHKEIYAWFNISYDNFSRTSREIHHAFVKEFFLKVHKNKYLVEGALKLPYCTNCKRQLADRFIEGTCPACKSEAARGDQCEKCGNIHDPGDLINPHCTICRSEQIEFRETKHLFLDLPKLSGRIEQWVLAQKQWRPQVRNMALAWIKGGLKLRCITRNLSWGINVPIKGYEDLVFYVWSENALGYISATKEWHRTKWKGYWQQKGAKTYYFVGKDNIPFHTVLFPAELLAHGGFNLPYNVVGLQYLNYEGGKFSKSKGRGVFCENLPNAGLDAEYWRFYLTYLIPETKDTDFSWSDFQRRVNSDLIGNFSNFINRTLKFIWNKWSSKIPQGAVDDQPRKAISQRVKHVLELYEKVELRGALRAVLALSDYGNKYFDEKKPWETNDKQALYVCAHLCKILALLMQPILPQTSEKVLQMLNCKETNLKNILRFNLRGKINEPKILFSKLEDGTIEELKNKTAKITEYFAKT